MTTTPSVSVHVTTLFLPACLSVCFSVRVPLPLSFRVFYVIYSCLVQVFVCLSSSLAFRVSINLGFVFMLPVYGFAFLACLYVTCLFLWFVGLCVLSVSICCPSLCFYRPILFSRLSCMFLGLVSVLSVYASCLCFVCLCFCALSYVLLYLACSVPMSSLLYVCTSCLSLSLCVCRCLFVSFVHTFSCICKYLSVSVYHVCPRMCVCICWSVCRIMQPISVIFFDVLAAVCPCYGVERGVLVKNVHTPSFHFHPPTRKLGATPPQIQDAPGSNVRRAPLLLFRFISGYDHRYNISGYDTDGVKLVSFGA